jgi:hypothetical protein
MLLSLFSVQEARQNTWTSDQLFRDWSVLRLRSNTTLMPAAHRAAAMQCPAWQHLCDEDSADLMYQLPTAADELAALYVATAHGLCAHCKQLLITSHRSAVTLPEQVRTTPP